MMNKSLPEVCTNNMYKQLNEHTHIHYNTVVYSISAKRWQIFIVLGNFKICSWKIVLVSLLVHIFCPFVRFVRLLIRLPTKFIYSFTRTYIFIFIAHLTHSHIYPSCIHTYTNIFLAYSLISIQAIDMRLCINAVQSICANMYMCNINDVYGVCIS